MFEKRMLVSCLTVLFDSPFFDDSLKASKHKYISLSLNRHANPFDKRNVVILNNLLLIKAAKLRE